MFGSFVKDKRATVVIRYKSGKTITVRVEKITVTREGGSIAGISWTNMTPDPLFIGLDNIESVWQK